MKYKLIWFGIVGLLIAGCRIHKDSNYYYLKGINYNAQSKFDSAIFFLNNAVSVDSMNGYAYQYRGFCYLKKDDLEKAISDLEIADQRGAHDYNTNYYLGKAYYDLREYKKALISFYIARVFNPMDTTINLNMALCCDKLKDKECTRRYIKQYLQFKPHDEKALVLLAYTYYRTISNAWQWFYDKVRL